MLNRGHRARDLTSDKGFAAARTFVVEQDAVARAKAVALAVVYRDPIRKNLRYAVRTARPKWRRLILRHLFRVTKHFAARCLVETRTHSCLANGFQNADRPNASDIRSVFRDIEAHAHM